MRYIFFVLLLVFLTGCVQQPNVPTDRTIVYKYKKNSNIEKIIVKNQKNYTLGKVYKVYIGMPIITETHKKELIHSINPSSIYEYKALIDIPPFIKKDKIYYLYSYDKFVPEYQYLLLGDYNVQYKRKIFVKINKNGDLIDDNIYDVFGNILIFNAINTSNNKVFETLSSKKSKYVVLKTLESFKKELLYMGLLNNNIKIVYREFYNNMIRSPFTQEVFYPFNKNKIIRYQNYKIKVLDANNEFIKYKVIED
ncbi:hypothetical protein [Nitrosophilus kaiyonis]|uniref:hypothetical protein n=1 Tax=Nitrosophilus kaiyonis TaxID=2930200 RepID=UPI0024914B23|nr:hypothetical protein [Nitrosophilus kaiyonis]